MVIKMENNNLNQENNQTLQNNFQQTTMQNNLQQPMTQQNQTYQQTQYTQNYQTMQNNLQQPMSQQNQTYQQTQYTQNYQTMQNNLQQPIPQQINNTKEKKKSILPFIIIAVIIVIIIALCIGINKIFKNNEENNPLKNNPISNVNNEVENSKKYYYHQIANSYVNIARTYWAAEYLICNGKLQKDLEDGDYYVMIDTREGAKDILPLTLDMGVKSPWDNKDVFGYVRINLTTTDENIRKTKYFISLSDGTHTIADDNTTEAIDLEKENIIMKTDKELLNKVKLTTDEKDASGKYKGTSDCTFDTITNKYTCSNFTGYDKDAINKMKAICTIDK
jgi:hypothetical protein